MLKQILVILAIVICSATAHSQDPQFSQVFAAPLYLGPSFAGATGGTRVATNFRDQWPALKREYVSYSLSVDHFFRTTNNSIGLAVYRDHAGMGLLTSTYCMLQYSYVFNITRKMQLRPGIEASFNTRNINYNRIVFGDQLAFEGNLPTTIETSIEKNVSYIDFATSAALFHPFYWLGFSIHHLTIPNQSLLGAKSQVPVKISFYGGKKIQLKSPQAHRRGDNLYVAFEFKNQAKFNQLYTGAYWEYAYMTIGLWYRGIPMKKTFESYFNNDAVVIVFSYTFDKLKMGYSYDITTSHLLTRSAGSHEVSLVYVMMPKGKPKRKIVPCPMQ